MTSYAPSGREPPVPQKLFVALGTGVGVGLLGGGAIIVFARMAVSAAQGVSSSGGLTFGGLVVASLMVWLAAFVPYGMGWLCGAGAGLESRNPQKAGNAGFLAAVLCFAVMVPIVMAGYGMTFTQWLNLSWATAKGVTSGGYGMAWIHLIPLGTLLLTGAFVASSRAERPYCEVCGEFCASRPLGEVLDLPSAKPEGDAVSDAAQYVGRIVAAKIHTEEGETWGAARLALCERCKKVGFLSVERCTLTKGDGGKSEVKKQPLATLLTLTEEQLASVMDKVESPAAAPT